MGFTTDVVTGLAKRLQAAGVGQWRPLDGYVDGETAIVIGPHMPQTPDRVICLTPYPALDEPGLTEVTVAVQVRCRGTADPTTAEDLADAVYDALNGASNLLLGDVPVAQIYRRSSSPLGPDVNHRHERSDNYWIQANRASTYATD